MSVRVPSGEIRRTCHKGMNSWECPWDLDISTAGKQVVLEMTTDDGDKEPVLTVELRFDRDSAARVLDLFLAAMVEAGHRK